jgi:hypothetical protein
MSNLVTRLSPLHGGFTLALALAGCTDPSGLAGGEPDLGPPISSPDDLANVPDGATGWARVRTPHGVELLPYVARNGIAVYEGDTDLGPVTKVDARLRGGALTETGTRWSNSSVQFAFHPSFTGSARTTVRQALTELEAITPINFHEVTYGQHTGPWLEFKWGSDSSPFAGMSSAAGMMGCGEIHCSSEGECRTDCGQWIYFNASKDQPTKSTTKHEVLHALGLHHEQSRNDRDAWIDYNGSCVASSSSQFAIKSASEDLGPYDYRSIMHYSSGSFCVTSLLTESDPYLNGCLCLPMTKWADNNNDGKQDKISPSGDLTNEDVNTLWRAYHRAKGVDSSGDDFGRALATGDFDNDGYDDLAIGAPGNNSAAGSVFVFKGVSNGFVPWAGFAHSAAAAGDHFGAALAAGDIDGDGFDELLVGVPDRDAGTAIDAGEVRVYKGSRGGLTFDHSITQVDGGGTNEAGDRFGAAVAIANFTNRLVKEVVIGAPGDRVNTTLSNVKSGAVYILHEDPNDLFATPPTRLARGFGSASDDFGATLAVGTIDADANQDLAIGAPGDNAVHVYSGRTPPEDYMSWSAMALYRQTLTGPAGGAADRFGGALLIADVSGTTRGEVVVGAPGVASSVGRVYVYNLATAALTGNTSMALAQTVLPNGSQEAGDEFGYSLAAFQRDAATPQLDLVVGSPGENGNVGVITLYRGDTGGVTAIGNVFQSAIPLQLDEAGDRFGTSIAAGQFDGIGNQGSSDMFAQASNHKADLVIGAPGETIGPLLSSGGPAAGAFDLMLQGSGGAMIGRGAYHQGYSAPE